MKEISRIRNVVLKRRIISKKVNRKVQEKPQAEAAANPWHQEEEKTWHRLTCV